MCSMATELRAAELRLNEAEAQLARRAEEAQVHCWPQPGLDNASHPTVLLLHVTVLHAAHWGLPLLPALDLLNHGLTPTLLCRLFPGPRR